MKVNPSSPTPAYAAAEKLAAAVRSSTMPEDGVREDPANEKVVPATTDDPAGDPPSAEPDVDQLVEMANDLARSLNVTVSFTKSEKNDTVVLHVIDKETGEVIRQVPPEEMLARIRNFDGLEGLLTRTEG